LLIKVIKHYYRTIATSSALFAAVARQALEVVSDFVGYVVQI